MEKVIVITADQKIYSKELPEDGFLEGLQEIVGGWIEVVHPRGLTRPHAMVCNEEGIIQGLDLNLAASILYGWLVHGNPILGDVAIVKDGWRDGEPDIVGFTDKEAAEAIRQLTHTFKALEEVSE